MTKRKKYTPPPNKIEFEVTQDDIDRGKRNNVLECPVALALDRTIEERSAVIGFYHIFLHSRVYGERPTICVRTPESIRQYIKQYDDTGVATPEKFQLEIET